jgi:hypothetical protein
LDDGAIRYWKELLSAHKTLKRGYPHTTDWKKGSNAAYHKLYIPPRWCDVTWWQGGQSWPDSNFNNLTQVYSTVFMALKVQLIFTQEQTGRLSFAPLASGITVVWFTLCPTMAYSNVYN